MGIAANETFLAAWSLVAAEMLVQEVRAGFLAKPFILAHFRDALAQALDDQRNSPAS